MSTMTEREMLIAKANEEVEIQRMLADACEDEGDLEGAADCMKLVILLRNLVASLTQQQEAEPQHDVVMCDCHLHETQVCDICQGVDGTEVDATPINYRAHAEALAEASTLAIEYWEHRMQRYKNRHPVWVVEMRAALAAFDQAKPAAQPARCEYCDGSGDIHSFDGEWLGSCAECQPAAQPQPEPFPMQGTDGGRNELYEGLFDDETARERDDRLRRARAAQPQVPDDDEMYRRFCAWCEDNKQYDLDPRLHTHSGKSVSDGAYISDGVTRALYKAYRDGAISAAKEEGK